MPALFLSICRLVHDLELNCVGKFLCDTFVLRFMNICTYASYMYFNYNFMELFFFKESTINSVYLACLRLNSKRVVALAYFIYSQPLILVSTFSLVSFLYQVNSIFIV